jgi:hypothetical protein
MLWAVSHHLDLECMQLGLGNVAGVENKQDGRPEHDAP